MPPTGPTVDPAKKEKFINIFIQRPKSSVFSVMKQAKFTKEDIADVALRRFLQRALPGGSIKGLKAYISGLLPPPPRHNPHPERLVADAIVNNVEANIVHVEECSTTPVTVNSVVNVERMTAKAVAKRKAVKRKARNMRFYKNKKARVHSSSPAAITTTTTTTTTTMHRLCQNNLGDFVNTI
jgi:hypothetical protein